MNIIIKTSLIASLVIFSLNASQLGQDVKSADPEKTGNKTVCCSQLLTATGGLSTPSPGVETNNLSNMQKAGTVDFSGILNSAVASAAAANVPFETQLYGQNWAGSGTFKIPNGAKTMSVWLSGGGGGTPCGYGGTGGTTCFGGTCVSGGQGGRGALAALQVAGSAPGGNGWGSGIASYTGGSGGTGWGTPWGSTSKRLDGGAVYPVNFGTSSGGAGGGCPGYSVGGGGGGGNAGGGGGGGSAGYWYSGGGGGSGYATSFTWSVTPGQVYSWSVGGGGGGGCSWNADSGGTGGAGVIWVKLD